MPQARAYELSVFVNCPFDEDYRPLLWAIIFTVHDCGFIARSALESSNAGQIRIEKVTELIASCMLGIHDLSRTELDPHNHLPRFNMPLELGIFLGAKWLGTRKQKRKIGLVLDRERYRYQKFCSDIAGQDVAAHGDDPQKAVHEVRDWLRTVHRDVAIPGGKKLWERYQQFLEDLPLLCQTFQLEPTDLTFSDYTALVSA